MSRPIPLTRLATSISPLDIDELFPANNEPADLSVPGPPWKRTLHAILEQPASSPAAFVMHVFSTSLIVISAVVTVLETVPAFHSISGGVWFGVETSLVALFTMEYVARTIAWSGSWSFWLRWVFSFYGVVDLLAILPYYIEIAMHQDTSTFFRFSILRTFRLLRVFKPFRSNNTILLTIEVMFLSFRRSQHALLALSFFVVMVLVIFSTLLYFIERGTWDASLDTFVDTEGMPSQFSSIPSAAWFVLVTITTVGYGEITPHSFLGRLVTIPLLVFGLLVIALPTFVLGREFSVIWDMMSRNQPLQNEPSAPALLGSTYQSPLDSFGIRLNGGGSSSDMYHRDAAIHTQELSKQLSDLQTTVVAQGELIRRLLNEFETKGRSDIEQHTDLA